MVQDFLYANPDVAVVVTLTVLMTANWLYELLLSPSVKRWVPEKAMPGSVYIKPIPVTYQVEVQTCLNGVWVTVGQAIRVRPEYYMTPVHVVSGLERISLRRGDKRVEINAIWEHVHGDLALLPVPENISGQLQVTVGKLAKVGAKNSVANYVYVTADERSSFGQLTSADEFGMVKYAGSTAPGFSGAAYAVNNTVFGMHLGCEASNMGYDATFMDVLITRYLSRNELRKESTEDWLLDTMSRRHEELEFKVSPFNPDELMVQVNGRYHMIDADEFYRAKQRRLRGESLFAPRSVAYTDSGNEFPGPARLPVGAGGPGRISENTRCAHKSSTSMTESIQESECPEDYEINPTDHLLSILAQQNEVLSSMLQERISVPNQMSHSAIRRMKKRQKQRAVATGNGSGISQQEMRPSGLSVVSTEL